MNHSAPGSESSGNYRNNPWPPQRRFTWQSIALAIAVVIIVALSAVVIAKIENSTSGTATAAAPSASREVAPSRAAVPPPAIAAQPMTCEGFTAQVDPGSRPGWQPTVGKRGLAYAAPPEWSVGVCGAQIGWQAPCPDGQDGVCAARAMSAVSTLADSSCENGNFAMAGVAGSKRADIRAALEDEAKTVPIIYAGTTGHAPTVEFGPIREFNIGSHPAIQTVATVTDIKTAGCTGPAALHSIVVTTVPNIEGPVVFLISLRQGSAGAPDPEVINEMVDTLRSPA